MYDLLAGIDSPVKTLNLCEDALKAIAPHDEGKLIAVGGKNGIVYLVESSEALSACSKTEKTQLSAVRFSSIIFNLTLSSYYLSFFNSQLQTNFLNAIQNPKRSITI